MAGAIAGFLSPGNHNTTHYTSIILDDTRLLCSFVMMMMDDNIVFDRGQYNPTLNYQLSGAHFSSDGSLTKGSLRAIIPMAKVQALYPEFTTQDATTYFNVTRTGDSGSQDSITFTTWDAVTHGTAGVLFEVTGVTFSAPTYKLSHNGSSLMVPSLFITLLCAVIALILRQ